MMHERVSVIKVDVIDINIVHLFTQTRTRAGEIVPQPGVTLYKIGEGRFSASRVLEGGGRHVVILEIVDGVLKSAAN